jgi:uncharacterized protein YndB with AHSA1/START domain
MSVKEDVTVTTLVEADPMSAFELFTRDVDLWWRRGPRHRPAVRGDGTMRFEPGVGGRFLEIYDDSRGEAFELGRILVWEPGARLVFEWRAASFAASEKTEVEIRFEAEGDFTRVTLHHRGWESIPAKHPSRHGWTGEAFRQLIGLRWAELLVFFRTAAHERKAKAS